MTWSISASGTTEEVRAKVLEAKFSGDQTSPEARVFEAVQLAVGAQLDAIKQPHASVSAFGSNYSCSISITGVGAPIDG